MTAEIRGHETEATPALRVERADTAGGESSAGRAHQSTLPSAARMRRSARRRARRSAHRRDPSTRMVALTAGRVPGWWDSGGGAGPRRSHAERTGFAR